METPEVYMQRCLQLAAIGAGCVAPNPMVGAVLVYRNRIIGEGWHARYGGPHAEVVCFEHVRPEDKPLIPESTLYVSLEPCAHFGKTPPCANRIVLEGVKKVVIGTRDPFSEVNGKGIDILQRAGVDVIEGVLYNDCRWLNRRFFTMHEKKRPYIHLKWAQSADGYIGSLHANRVKISNPLTDRWVHKWRSEASAIMVGTNTALLDKPQLNNRHWYGAPPVRIVIDRFLKIPHAQWEGRTGGPVWILNHTLEASKDTVLYKKIPMDGHHLQSILELLYTQGIQSVFVEGGKQLLDSFLKHQLWDELHVITNTSLQLGSGIPAPSIPAAAVKATHIIEKDYINWYINNGGDL